MKKAVALLVLLGLAAGLPYWGGLRAEREYERLVASLPSGERLRVIPVRYERGWLESTARMRVELDGSSEDDDPGFRFFVDHRISHGPLAFAELLQGRIPTELVVAVVETDIRPELDEYPALPAQDIIAVVNSVAGRLNTVLDSIADEVPSVMKDLERLGTELNVAVDSINAMLAPENAQRVTSILRNIDGLTGDANELLAGLGGTRRRLDRLIEKLDGLLEEDTGDVAEAMAELNQSLAAVSRHIDAIAANLEVTTRNFSEFSKHIRDDPSLLIRGREAQDGG